MAYMVVHDIQSLALERLKEIVSRTPETFSEAERDGIIAGTALGILRGLHKLNAMPDINGVASQIPDPPPTMEAQPEPYIPCECPLCAPEAGLDEDVEYILAATPPFDGFLFGSDELYRAFFGDKP